MKIIETERLILRTWESEDAEALFNINQDTKLVEWLGNSMTMEQVKNFIVAKNNQAEKYGYTLWATELKEAGELIGFIGLNYISWEAPFTPAVEIGWRLGSRYWRIGCATEGAKAALDFGFNKIGLEEIVSFTVPANNRSRKVMEKIGMNRDFNGDFTHTKLPTDHPLSKHVLYRKQKL